jgi:hypothetical protein
MERSLQVINQLVADGVIEKYAIGGAMAVPFYIEPDTTFDLDIFFLLSAEAERGLALLAPIYQYLEARGYRAEGEAVMIEDLPVQFIPAFNPLIEEAVERANQLEFAGIPVTVMSAEHLMAIMLQTGRGKDFARILRFLEKDAVDLSNLNEIIERHSLVSSWNEFRQRFGL